MLEGTAGSDTVAGQVGADINVLPESKPDSQHRGHIKGRPLQPQVVTEPTLREASGRNLPLQSFA